MPIIKAKGRTFYVQPFVLPKCSRSCLDFFPETYGRSLPRSGFSLPRGALAFPCGAFRLPRGPPARCAEGERFPLGSLDEVFILDPFCGGLELFRRSIGAVSPFAVDADRFIALGGRSFRLFLAAAFSLPPGRFPDPLFPEEGRLAFPAVLAAITPFPRSTPALALAATAGRPWFTDAS